MIRNARFEKLPAALLLCLPLIALLSREGLSQRNDADLTAFLLNGADCVVSSSSRYHSDLDTEADSMPIGNQVFTRLFSLSSDNEGENSTLACRASNQEFSTASLQMGIDDNSVQSGTIMTINIYQGGNLKHTYRSVEAGRMISVLLDLNDPQVPNNPDSFAVEIFDCQAASPRHACYLQFTEATLYPSGSVTSLGSNGTISPILPEQNYSLPAPSTPLPSAIPSSSPTEYGPSDPRPPWLRNRSGG